MLCAVQRIRVEWSHCDPAGIIFNPHYFIWMDQGSHRLFEAAGFSFVDEIGRNGYRGCPLVSSGADYLAPVRFGDVIELESQVVSFGNRSFRCEHRFSHDGKTVAKGFEVRVWGMSGAGDPPPLIAVPVPQDIKDMLSRDGIVDTTIP